MKELLESVQGLLGSSLTLLGEEHWSHSRILRVSISNNHGHQRYVIKQILPDQNDPAARDAAIHRLHAEYTIMKKVYEGLETDSRFLLVRPVGYVPEYLALVMEESPGSSLSGHIQRKGKGWPTSSVRQSLRGNCNLAGEWLRRFQALTSQQGKTRPFFQVLRSDIGNIIECLTERPRVRFSRELGAEVLAYMNQILGGAAHDKAAVTGKTGEFSPGNMLVDGERLTVLDFGMYTLGASMSDAAQFYNHLEMFRHKPIYRPSLVRELQRGFLDGYGQPELERDQLFSLYLIRFKLSRMEATSGRKWSSFGPARRAFCHQIWRLQRREIRQLLMDHEP